MRRSPNRYRAPTRVHRPNHLPYIFNTARLRSASGHIRRLAQTVLCLFFRCLILLLALKIFAQLIGRPPAAPEKLVTDPNRPNLPSGNDHHLECPDAKLIDDCLSCLFGNRTRHGPGICDMGCPRTVVTAVSGAHLNTSHFAFPLQDILLHMATWRPHTVPVGPEGPSGQCHLPLPVTSYNPAFRVIFNEMTAMLDFILWHTTLVAFDSFLRLSLMLHEYGPADWTKRETWRKFKKTASLSGNRGISSPCQKRRVFLCIFVRCPLTVCMAVVKRYKCRAVSKQVCGLLAKLPSLRLWRGVKSGRNIHGRLVVSFTVQRSFVMRIRFRPSSPCLVLLRHVASLSESFTKAVSAWTCAFLSLLLLLAGDVEVNPGPRKGKRKAVADDSSSPMSPWNDDALVSLKRELKKNVLMNTGLADKLEKAAGGFMSRTEAQMVTALSSNSDQIDRVIETLRGKTNEDFDTFCKMLRQTNHVTWVVELEKKAEQFKRGGGKVSVEWEGKVGGGQVESFFSQLRKFYTSMKIVEDERLPADRSIQYVNLALADFKLGFQHAHKMFVDAMREGVDNVYTCQTRKIDCKAIPKLVKEHKLVVISGAPGVGKSTLARKVCQDVCNSPGCSGYITVLLVELRDLLLFKKDFILVDILRLFQGTMGDTILALELSEAIYGNQGRDVLFILDGFDELPPHLRQSDFLMNLLSHSRDSPLRDCDVVLTSRSIVTSEIYHQMQQSRAQVTLANIEVLGFTQDQIKEYAGQYFADQGQPGLLDSFVSKIDAIPQIRGLCSIPVVLSIICEVFVFAGDLPPTLTQIYDVYLCVKIRKYSKKLKTLNSILDLPRGHDMYKLGEIAYNCIQSQKVVFDSADLQGLGEHFSNRERGCGVLTARPVRADPRSEKAVIKSFFFIHLTVQEFIAAVYVALLPAEMQREIWAKYLGKPHMAQVWRFYCGITKLEHYQLFQNKITAYPKDFQMQCLFECQNASLVRQLMPRIVGEKVTVEPKTAYDSTAYGYCLSKHLALQKLTIDTHIYAGSAEIHRLLEPVYASGTLQTLYLRQGSDWEEIEVTLDRLVSQEREASTGDSQKDGALNGHFGKVLLQMPPLSVAVKVLCLQHVREVECVEIQGCEAMDPEMLREMEKALEENKTLEMLTLADVAETLPKEFCRHVLFGTRRSTSLSLVHLGFDPPNWDCPGDVPADAQGSVQRVNLANVSVDVLPKLWSWFSQVKQLECHDIHPPQERGVGEEGMLNDLEQTLSGMGRWKKLVLGIGSNLPDSLTLTVGMAILKGISRNPNIKEFVLFQSNISDRVLRDILQKLTTDERRRFTIGRYGPRSCIRLSASVLPLSRWAPPQPFPPRQMFPDPPAVGYRPHSVGQHQVGQEQVDPSPQTYPTLLLQDTQGVSGAGRRQEYMAPPTAAASHVRGHCPGDRGYVACDDASDDGDGDGSATDCSEDGDSSLLSPSRPTTPPLVQEDQPTLRHRYGPHHSTPPPPHMDPTHTDTPTLASSLSCSVLILIVAVFVTLCLLITYIMTV